jgi:hypothetical protein
LSALEAVTARAVAEFVAAAPSTAMAETNATVERWSEDRRSDDIGKALATNIVGSRADGLDSSYNTLNASAGVKFCGIPPMIRA